MLKSIRRKKIKANVNVETEKEKSLDLLFYIIFLKNCLKTPVTRFKVLIDKG